MLDVTMKEEAEEPTKAYLGDSVYAEIENGMVKLTTDNGYGPSNIIYLEKNVVSALWNYTYQYNEKII